MTRLIFILLLPLVVCISSAAGESDCPRMRSVIIAECGNRPLTEVAPGNARCLAGTHLLRFTDWLDTISKPCSVKVADVEQRYAFFRDTVTLPVVYPANPVAGTSKNAARIVVYISMSCPMCKRICAELADSIVSGNGRDIALYLKPFSATQLERAFVAIGDFGKQAALFRALAPIKERVTIETIFRITDSIGIDRPTLKKLMASADVAARVDSSRAEAIRNGVSITPTFFINGKRYNGYKNTRWVLDAAVYKCEISPR